MDEHILQGLNAHAEAVAERLGFHAGVVLQQLEASDVNRGGPRIVLTVFRDRRDRQRSRDFAPTTGDLKARIEQEIPLLASEIQS